MLYARIFVLDVTFSLTNESVSSSVSLMPDILCFIPGILLLRLASEVPVQVSKKHKIMSSNVILVIWSDVGKTSGHPRICKGMVSACVPAEEAARLVGKKILAQKAGLLWHRPGVSVEKAWLCRRVFGLVWWLEMVRPVPLFLHSGL